MVAEHYVIEFIYYTLRQLKTWLHCNMKDFHVIFHFETTQNLVAEHYEGDFDMIFHYMAPQSLVAEHYERDFGMILHFKAAYYVRR